MKATIKARAIRYARRYPGQSATQIAHAIGARPSTVSAELYHAVKRGELVRTEAAWSGRGNFWNVAGGGGPGGGHTYGPTELARAWYHDVVAFVRRGMMINAIRCVREHTRIGLRDALNVVDQDRPGAGAPLKEFKTLADWCTRARVTQ